MATYKFDQWNIEIVNPVVDVVRVSDAISEKTCSVDITLTTTSAKFGVNLKGFTYINTWDDSEIIFWVNNVELPKYEVNP